MSKRAPRNTSRWAAEMPEMLLAEALAFGPSAAIERQEAQGQQSFVHSDTLPTDMGRGRFRDDPDAKAILEAAGVKFLGPVEGDPLFQYVELPAGWKKVPTDHSMWSKLVDGKDRERAAIFYKAAYYDRSAHLRLMRRFSVEFDYDCRDREAVIVASAKDCGKPVFTTDPVPGQSYEATDAATALAARWLDEHYPNWHDPAAYWD